MAEPDLKKDFDALRKDLDALRADVGQLAGTLKETAGRKASQGASRARDEAQALRARLDEIVAEVEGHGRDGLRAVENEIQQKPLIALASAFAIGMVLGKLLDRR